MTRLASVMVPVLAALATNAIFTTLDLCAQVLQVDEGWTVQQVIAVRMGGSLVCCIAYNLYTTRRFLPWTLPAGGPRELPSRKIKALVWIRAISDYLAITAGYLSFRLLPLSEGITLYSLNPFPMMLLCYIFLGERVSAVQSLSACVSTFAVLMIAFPRWFGAEAEPGPKHSDGDLATGERLLGYIVGFLHAAFIAISMFFVRAIGKRVTLGQLLTTFSIVTSIGAMAEMTVTWSLPSWPSTSRGMISMVGLVPLSIGGHIFGPFSIRGLPGAVVAILGYSAIVFGGCAQWAVYRHAPSIPAMTGMALICIAGSTAVLYPAEDKEATRDKALPDLISDELNDPQEGLAPAGNVGAYGAC